MACSFGGGKGRKYQDIIGDAAVQIFGDMQSFELRGAAAGK